MRYVRPTDTLDLIVDNAPTGLVGTIGVTVKDTDGSTLVARRSAGITEDALPGIYRASIPAPSGGWPLPAEPDDTIAAIWDTGDSPPQVAVEEFAVTANPPALVVAGGYTTPGAVRNVLAPDGDPGGDLGTAASLGDEQIQEAINDAASEIDAKLAPRFSVPFAGAVPVVIAKLNADIAAYLATLTHSGHEPLADTHPIRLRYARARDTLTALAKGEGKLLGEDGEIASSAEAFVANPHEGDLFSLEDFGLGTANDLGRRWPVG